MRPWYDVGMDTPPPKSDLPTQSDDVDLRQSFGMAMLVSAIMAGFEYMVYRALALAERGEPAAVWKPIAEVYELWGKAAALSVIPSLWVILMGIAAWQTRVQLRRQRKNSN